jgi:uncharacterized protein (DUF983 family)
MGRNARKRAAAREEGHPHGVKPEVEDRRGAPGRCPQCGSSNLFVGRTHGIQYGYVDVICGNCSWQGEIPIQGWAP